MTPEERLQEYLKTVNQVMPPAPEPKGLYRPVVAVGGLLFTSGHLPIDEQGRVIQGTLGGDLSEEEGRRAALAAGLGILASVRAALGGLDRIRRVVKLTGLVQSAPGFTGQPRIINACSELLAAVFGEQNGVGARTACGTNALPLNAAVEIEAIFELRDAAAGDGQ